MSRSLKLPTNENEVVKAYMQETGETFTDLVRKAFGVYIPDYPPFEKISNAKRVRATDANGNTYEFKSARDGARAFGCSFQNVYNALTPSHQQKTAVGMTWEYIDEPI